MKLILIDPILKKHISISYYANYSTWEWRKNNNYMLLGPITLYDLFADSFEISMKEYF